MADDGKKTVTITIRRPSRSPPVFVAASFTDPPWELLELDAKPLSSSSLTARSEEAIQVADENPPAQYEFSRTFKLGHGRYQYKFRLGLDGTWMCNEELETGEC